MRTILSYSFESAREQWGKVPVDDVGYISVGSMLTMRDKALCGVVDTFKDNRYNKNGWRNYQNKWRELLGLDNTHDKVIMDFGCGMGIESLEFARWNNKIILADINRENILLASRVLRLHGYDAIECVLVGKEAPFFPTHFPQVDVFYANSVLHHTPLIKEILQRACEILSPNGEIRLMLYSDKGWKIATGKDAPAPDSDVTKQPEFQKFVSYFDGVGYYANWFNKERLNHFVGDFLSIQKIEYITNKEYYLVAILKPKG